MSLPGHLERLRDDHPEGAELERPDVVQLRTERRLLREALVLDPAAGKSDRPLAEAGDRRAQAGLRASHEAVSGSHVAVSRAHPAPDLGSGGQVGERQEVEHRSQANARSQR